MAYPEHYLLSFGGHSGDTLDTWTCGIRLGVYNAGLLEEPNAATYLTSVAAPALQTWFNSAGARIYNGARLQWAKFNKINTMGKYALTTTTHLHTYPTAIAGGTAVAPHPLQVSLVLSWRTTAAARGLASRGRIYSPRPAILVSDEGDIDSAARTATATAATVLLNTLDVPVGSVGVMRPSIVSPGVGWPGADNPGTMNQINSVVVDSQLDIQRRRARSASREQTTVSFSY